VTKLCESPICRSLPDLHQPYPADLEAASAAGAAGTADTPDNHREAAVVLAEEVAGRCVRAFVVAVVSRRSSDSPTTFAALGCSGPASAVAAVAVAARRGRNRRRQRACLWSGGCLSATRSRLWRVLAGCLSSMCECCWGGSDLESQRTEVRWGWSTGLQRLAVVLVSGRLWIAAVLAIGPGRPQE